MRPFVSSFVALAAVSLTGVALAGSSLHAPAWGSAAPADGAGDSPAHAVTPGFYAPSAALPGRGPGLPRGRPANPRRPIPAPSSGSSSSRAPSTPAAVAAASTRRRWGRRCQSWATDYPKADRQFLVVVQRLTNLDLFPNEHAVALDDPDLRRFPFLYTLEVGHMNMTQSEVHGLRDYLNAGGFLVIDDFWGTYEWANFEREISRVLPGRPIVDIPLDHPLFEAFYDIKEIMQVPNVNNGMRGSHTWEQDGVVPHVRGIFDDHGRLMVVINWNTDLGDAWEWAENPYYPLKYSTFAYQMGVNMIIYGMSH